MKQLIGMFGPDTTDEEIVAAIKGAVESDRRGDVAEELRKHAAPIHPGTGSDQSVHGVGRETLKPRKLYATNPRTGKTYERTTRAAYTHVSLVGGVDRWHNSEALAYQRAGRGGTVFPVNREKAAAEPGRPVSQIRRSDRVLLVEMELQGSRKLYAATKGSQANPKYIKEDQEYALNEARKKARELRIDPALAEAFVRGDIETIAKRTIERTPDYPHGPSVKWPKVYRGLRRRGFTKEEAARISNEMSAKYRRGRRIPLSRTAGQKPIPEDILDKKPELRKHGTHDQSTHGNWADRINRQLQEEGYHYDFESLRSLFRAALFQAYDTGSDRVTIKIPGGSDFSVPRRMVDAALYEQVTKHGGPGPHESGSEQTAHGRKGFSSETPTAASPPESLAVTVADAPPEDPALVHQTYSQGLKTFGQRLDFIMQVAGEGQMSRVDYQNVDTMGMYSNWEGGRWAGYTDERLAWQVEALGQMELEQIEANDGRFPKTDRQAIVMAGLPGSGKTFVLKSNLGEHFDLRDYVVINADDIKSKIIFDDTPPKIEDLEGLELSSVVHEESSDMAQLWESDLIRRGSNIALDITAANEAKTLKRIKSLEADGYTVHLVHVDVSIEESLASTLIRAASGSPGGEKLGRPVPPTFIEGMRADENKDVIDKAFPKYAEAANGKVFSFRNYPISRKPPVLTFESA